MTPEQIVKYAETIASMLRALGPRPRARMLLVLRALGLSEEDAAAVVVHGLVMGMFVADPVDPTILRVP